VLQVIRAAAATNARAGTTHMVGTFDEQMRGLTVAPGQPAVSGTVRSDFDGVFRLRPMGGRITLTHLVANGSSAPGGIVELITPSAFYINNPQLQATTGKPWLKIPLGELSGASGVNLQQMISQAQQMQPGQFIDQLEQSGDLHVVGTQVIRGIRTTHYAGTVPMTASLRQYSGAVRRQMSRVLSVAGIRSTEIDIWLDGKGLMRRAHSSARGEKMSLSIEMDMLAYGVHVDVTPPPAADTVDISTLH
jgi:hypothetical protein